MTDGELATALVEWGRAELTEIVGAYDHLPKRHTQGWPELGVGITRRVLTTSMPGVGQAPQQVLFDLRSCELVVALAPEPAAESVDALRDFAGRLLGALRRDLSLGQRVEVASPLADVDYEPGEIQGEDGTEMRGFTFNLSVADRIPAP